MTKAKTLLLFFFLPPARPWRAREERWVVALWVFFSYCCCQRFVYLIKDFRLEVMTQNYNWRFLKTFYNKVLNDFFSLYNVSFTENATKRVENKETSCTLTFGDIFQEYGASLVLTDITPVLDRSWELIWGFYWVFLERHVALAPTNISALRAVPSCKRKVTKTFGFEEFSCLPVAPWCFYCSLHSLSCLLLLWLFSVLSVKALWKVVNKVIKLWNLLLFSDKSVIKAAFLGRHSHLLDDFDLRKYPI